MTNPWQPGYVLDGRFELIKLVGAGAMGVVWRVFDREWGRDLALKMPQAAVFESPELRERFVREAETWIGLGVHPHIVQCWFVSEVHGVPCLFLDYLTGGSLDSWMENGHVKPGQWPLILEIAMQVAEGLAYAHSKGVIHRDVKPENLMIRGDERVCVTDFGIVKTLTSEQTQQASTGNVPADLGGNAAMTAVGSFMGTPMYGAPEQWGSADQAGPQADMYALGVMLYEMCCGRRPFDTKEERCAPLTLINRHLSDRPPDPREFRADMPVELARLCLKMLAKKPDDRPSDMLALREFLADFHHQLTGKTFPPAAPLLSAKSPDVLNNQAYSLVSLGKVERAAEALRQGLSLDPGHPECLYNLVQLERRHGRVSAQEALRQLKQARAYLPYALLCIEEGMAAEALETLKALDPAVLPSPGLYHRASGDALMYLREYEAAEREYARAHQLMPKDAITQLRGSLARARGKHPAGAIFFPSSDPIRVERHDDPPLLLLLDDTARGLIAVTQTAVCYIAEGVVSAREERSSEGRPWQAWTAGRRLAIADSQGLELRLVPEMRPLARRPGRILACSHRIERLVMLEDTGPCLVVVDKGLFEPIVMKGQSPDQGPLLAAFDPSGQQLALLLPSGQLAGLDQANRAVPQGWPAQVEGHKEARCMALTADSTVVLGFSDGLVRSYHLKERKVSFCARLPQPAVALEAHAGDSRLLARGVAGFQVLDRAGQILLAGEGPVAVDPQGKRALFFHQGRMVMYHLNPLHLLRRWRHVMESPRSLAFSADGRMAVALSAGGESVLWEMDEPQRVYQRALLMSPGRTYSEILTAGQQFQSHLEQAGQALARKEPSESHRHLQRARKIPGYEHSGAALDFSWRLLEALRRDRLEAVWQRLSIEGTNPGELDLHFDGRQLLLSFGNEATLALYQDGGARPVWALQRKGRVGLLRFVEMGERSYVLVADVSGEVGLHGLQDGRLRKSLSLPGGPLSRLHLAGHTLTFLCQSGGLGQLNLDDGGTLFRDDLKIRPRVLSSYQRGKVLVATSGHLGVLDLRKPGSKLQALNLGLEIANPPCYIEYLEERGHLVLGFASGTLHIIEVATGKVLAALKHGEGRQVTAFQLLPELSAAITATATGHLCFWDLRNGQLMERFLAHRNGISVMRTSCAGRYLLTGASEGLVRYWETSWSAGEARRGGEATWLSLGKLLGRGGSAS